MKKFILLILAVYGFLFLDTYTNANASDFAVTSSAFENDDTMPSSVEANDFGCTGANKPPKLAWDGAPLYTKSYAISVYDPDALKGTGFWHYLAYDIPAKVKKAKNLNKLPAPAIIAKNDNDKREFTGPCPPVGSGKHHYIFTIYALDVEKLDISESAPTKKIVDMIQNHVIDTAKVIGIYERK